MRIPEKLDVSIITKEYFDLLCKDKKCSIPRVSNGRNGKFDKNILEQEILKANELYDYLTEEGKIKIGKNGHSKGLGRRYFIAKYIGVGEGVVEDYYANSNKEISSIDENDIQNEKNSVCKSKINPLLKKLGYEERHIKCNEAINMGRDAEAKIYCQADYQILSNENKLKNRIDKEFLNTAQIIIEAKCEPSETIHKWYAQAVTYARRLCAPYILIANQYKIILFYSSDNFITSKPKFECKWKELNNKETFNKLKGFIGRKQFTYNKNTHSYQIKS